jgi:TolB-like protein
MCDICPLMADSPQPLGAALADRYTIERELGSGGMATVYLAHDLRHGRQVAIKVLRPELAAVLGAERFLREIQIAAQLNHPHILGLIDSGTFPSEDGDPKGRPYYVMPYVEGESLRSRLDREPQLPLEDALSIAREVADALGYAHSRGIVHRDIKPENILLSGGHAVVADFGIARAIGTSGGTKLTETGMALGTPAYMSPEQSLAQEVDGRADIYALGCVLYETLVGEPPYTGPTAQAIIARRLSEPVPSLRVVRDAVPLSVEMAIHKALARTPADRFVTASQFVEALTAPVPETRERRRVLPRSRGARVGLAAMVVLVVAAGTWLAVRLRGPAVTPSASVIAVLPIFAGGSDTALTRLGQDVVILLSSNLDGVGGIRTVDARSVFSGTQDYSRSAQYPGNAARIGRHLGAGSVVSGALTRVGADVRLDLKLLSTDSTASAPSEPLAQVTFTNHPDSVTQLVDSTTFGLLRQIWRHGEPPTPSVTSVTTHNIQALRAFLQGEQLGIADHWPEAAAAYAAAFKEDSTFWLAAWRIDESQQWLPGEPDADSMLHRKYEAHLASFGERDRLVIEGEMTGPSEPFDAHLARFRAITERFPTDWAAWWPYADHLVHHAPFAGHSRAEAMGALERTVELNPKLTNAWQHLFQVSLGIDSAESARALTALTDLGLRDVSARKGHDVTLYPRLLVAAAGRLPRALVDSQAAQTAAANSRGAYFYVAHGFVFCGFPQAQIEFNRVLAARDAGARFAAPIWHGSAFAWAARGAWDSALAAMDASAAASTDAPPGVEFYQMAVAGALLGGLDPRRAAQRRPAAVRDLASAQPEQASSERAALAWSDGMLAFLQRDSGALAAARVTLRASGDKEAILLDRLMAGFALDLQGATRGAADSLDRDLTAPHWGIGWPRDPYARSATHLEAARLLLLSGDTSQARRLLTWHEADTGDGLEFQLFAPIAYLQMGRIADAQGRVAEAREDYHQFLRRYDMPVPSLRGLVDEANAALKRLSGQGDLPRTP